jgi:hypothetical protein
MFPHSEGSAVLLLLHLGIFVTLAQYYQKFTLSKRKNKKVIGDYIGELTAEHTSYSSRKKVYYCWVPSKKGKKAVELNFIPIVFHHFSHCPGFVFVG